MRRPCVVLIFVLLSSMMMLLGQGPMVNRSTRWRGQGPVVDRSPRVMMMMSGSRRPDIRSFPRSMCWSRMVRKINMLGLRAGPSRREQRSGPLPTLTAPEQVTNPGWLVTSLWSMTMLSVTSLITVWPVAIWSPSPLTMRINLPQTHWMRQSCWTSCHGIWKAGHP